MTDWRLRGLERRDVRNTKTEEIRPPAKSGNKNTKKWCRGVPGRKHQNEWIVENHWTYKLHKLKCVKCGKVLKYNFMSPRWTPPS